NLRPEAALKPSSSSWSDRERSRANPGLPKWPCPMTAISAAASRPLSDAAELSHGTAYSFSDWPNPSVPKFGAGVYTIWDKDGRFIYVGMSGRGMTDKTIRRNTPQGLYTRLQSHASGRRSGDQLCVYVADRLVLPTLSQTDIADIASGRHSMDAF